MVWVCVLVLYTKFTSSPATVEIAWPPPSPQVFIFREESNYRVVSKFGVHNHINVCLCALTVENPTMILEIAVLYDVFEKNIHM